MSSVSIRIIWERVAPTLFLATGHVLSTTVGKHVDPGASFGGEVNFVSVVEIERCSVRSTVLRIRKARSRKLLSGLFRINPGDFLLSHAVTRAVPSAPTGLTSVFGMGTGVTLSTKSPENLVGLRSLALGLRSS